MSERAILRMEGIAKSFGNIPAIKSARLEAHGGLAVAVMGANGAGKSTLMNILGGVVISDSGRILIDGVEIKLRSPRDATRHGIAFVHQELTMFPTMTVAENIFIDGMLSERGFIRMPEMIRQSKVLLARLGCNISPKTPVEQLSIGDRQLVEIARALRHQARIIIFDEPTSSLTGPERERLFSVIRGLKAEGVVIIYITHFLDEIFSICEQIAIMRNGETVWTSPISDVDPAKVVHLMLGIAEAEGRIRAPVAAGGDAMLSVSNLGRRGALQDVNFEIKRGEIVGLWGLLGSGRTELLRALIGLDPIDGGTIRWRDGAAAAPIAPADLHAHVGIVTEDRRGEGIHLPLSVAQNVALPNLRSLLNKWRLIGQEKEASLTDDMIKRLQIKVSGRQQPVGTLSGGNQQKVVFARWLATNPRLFLLDEPTRGLDVSAKAEIMKLVVELAQQGCSCLIVSSELQELMRVCDRYLVISRGRLIGELPGSATSKELMQSIATIN
ncbi:sugar ABC transporter ATP-binding protein [Rhizobium leguminosarum]|uniref:sugar ABC transporter ATP-binding protein n=1 Tax=Rhizobium leguminosarum TaxID=384 RepID=UPI001C90873D|nr:sugar ABC transporter ATP-binding protein [Rhizobium leguminosarum]MBY2919727.1 sugar ABC transporter ATP-binding protein [Rhizobium leguminosarum]MBY2975421.1 sugar ABC transporter ATP-binding protein [Rhizobium leguminosarum]MBY2977663.1 sugar ABC transporter ATP-binding protein [Rhizobium leguminosarum]MBY3006213.1 sugar ABC transporter ATP-binding protein [Rhizobium leguminosarum]